MLFKLEFPNLGDPMQSPNQNLKDDKGNPAQSAGRVSSREQDASRATPEMDPLETYPDLMPDSLNKNEKKP